MNNMKPMKLNKLNKFIIVVGMMLILSYQPITIADKIQKNDTWSYYDETRKKTINETSIDTIQLDAGRGDFLAVTKVNTTRGFQFPYDLTISVSGKNLNYSLKFNLKSQGKGNLLVTQEGGMPLWVNRLFVGDIILSASNRTYSYNYTFVINEIPRWKIEGTPSSAFATAESEAYGITSNFPNSNAKNENIDYKQWYVISSNENVQQLQRNYTITKTDIQLIGFVKSEKLTFSFIDDDGYLDWIVNINGSREKGRTPRTTPNIILSQQPDALLLSWDANEKLPTRIVQTEPAVIESLSLNSLNSLKQNQLFETVEYILVKNNGAILEVSENDDTPLSSLFIFGASLIIMTFYRSYKKTRY